MAVIAYLYVTDRLGRLREHTDRGDGPVPTAIIIVGLAIMAVALLALATTNMNGWLARLPAAPAAP